MCGLWGGLSFSFHNDEIDNILDLGVTSSLRGTDSTGLATVSRAKKGKLSYRVRKKVVNPVTFLNSPDIRAFINDNHPFCYMGHSRAATYGAVNEVNAHPFMEGRFIGCHNGSIYNYSPSKAEAHATSDSRELFKYMNTHGLVKALNKVGSGAYALTFLDTQQQTLNFIRNADRPLWLMFNTTKTVVYWSSERRMLIHMASVRGLDKFLDPFLCPVEVLHQFKLNDSMKLMTKDLKPELDENKGWFLIGKPTAPGSYPFVEDPKKQLSQYYCSKCKYNMRLCMCQGDSSPKYIKPFEHQISTDGTKYSEDGLKATPEQKAMARDIVKSLTSSVPSVKPGLGGMVCSSCEKGKEYCSCPLSIDEMPHYLGFKRTELTIQEAKELLNQGCGHCGVVSSVKDTVFWYDTDEHYCEHCWGDSEIRKVIHQSKMSVFRSKLVNGENYEGK